MSYLTRTTTLDGPDGPMTVVFGDATPEQWHQCCKLAATTFSSPLSQADYLEREEYLSQRPLARDKGQRIWCLSRVDNPAHVVTTCQTMHRNLLIGVENGSSEAQGYCITKVVTDARYRRHGLASLLLSHVAEWMDGPGRAAASMLYTGISNVRTWS
jgi:GNAT superfamily N-acetyltransferase